MKWTTRAYGKTVVHYVASGAKPNPPCSTARCERRNARKAGK